MIAYLPDKEFSDYYRTLLPKAWRVSPQKYTSHITIVRKEKEEIPDKSLWQSFDGIAIEFDYNPIVQFDSLYFYLKVYSKDIEEIRLKLGMPRFRFKNSPCYHITIGNIK